MLLKQLTLLKFAVYLFILALCSKGVYLYVSDHPAEANLIPVIGTVRDIKLGGNGSVTYLKVENATGMYKYSSYYGKVWPGMESVNIGDEVKMLAEKKRLDKYELLEGKSFYIWDMVHNGQVVVNYEDVNKLVTEKESFINRYINYWIIISFFIFLFALMRRDKQLAGR